MKILIYDQLFVKGHMHPNTHYTKMLSSIYDTTVVSTKGFFEELSEYADVIEVDTPYTVPEIKASRLKQVEFTRLLTRQIELRKFDVILFFSYDIEAFFLFRKFFSENIRIVLQEHNNVDKLDSGIIHRFIYGRFCNSVKHIVYENYMKEALVNIYDVDDTNVYVLPRARFSYEKCETAKSYSAIGLSGSNSDQYIEELINTVNEGGEKYRSLNIILKAHKKFRVNCDAIETITNRVSDEEYQELFSSTRIVLDPLPNTFKYRMSAVLFEALSSRKIVIGSDARIIQYFSSKYPHICFSANSPEEMLQLINQVSKTETEAERLEFNQFDDDYSDEKTMSVFKSIIEA